MNSTDNEKRMKELAIEIVRTVHNLVTINSGIQELHYQTYKTDIEGMQRWLDSQRKYWHNIRQHALWLYNNRAYYRDIQAILQRELSYEVNAIQLRAEHDQAGDGTS